MKAAIIYASVHHENTKKVVEAIAGENAVDLIDATKEKERDLSGYDLIGFASGVYYGKFHQTVLNFASVNLPANKDVFLICTCGGSAAFQSIEEVVKSKQGKIWHAYSWKKHYRSFPTPHSIHQRAKCSVLASPDLPVPDKR